MTEFYILKRWNYETKTNKQIDFYNYNLQMLHILHA